jgi:hypothetical protein
MKWLVVLVNSMQLQCRTVDSDFTPVRLRILCTGIASGAAPEPQGETLLTSICCGKKWRRARVEIVRPLMSPSSRSGLTEQLSGLFVDGFILKDLLFSSEPVV